MGSFEHRCIRIRVSLFYLQTLWMNRNTDGGWSFADSVSLAAAETLARAAKPLTTNLKHRSYCYSLVLATRSSSSWRLVSYVTQEPFRDGSYKRHTLHQVLSTPLNRVHRIISTRLLCPLLSRHRRRPIGLKPRCSRAGDNA